MRLVAAIALAACSSSAPAPALQGRAPHHTPTTPAPAIRWGGFDFDLAELPAVSRAGDRVVLGLADIDFGRGWRNLRFEVRERNDHLVSKHIVMRPDEHGHFLPDGETPSRELEQRIADANRWLADLHASHDLVTMRQLDADKPPLVVSFDNDRRLRVRVDGRVVGEFDGRAWTSCGNPAQLENVYKADGIDVIVVELGYIGDDSCTMPPDQVHVIAW